MLSKYSTDLGTQGFICRDYISTMHPSSTTQVKLGSCPELSANPNSKVRLTDTTE